MKINLAFHPAILMAATCLMACGQRNSDFQPLGNGFEVRVEAPGIDRGSKAGLFFKATGGKRILIWPNICGTDDEFLRIRDKTIVFLGKNLSRDKTSLDNRLLAARGAEPAIDITDQVLKLWADKAGRKVSDITDGSEIYWLDKQESSDANNEISANTLIEGIGDSSIIFSWKDVEKWLNEIKTPAKYFKDK